MIVDIFIGIVTVVLIIQSCIGLSFFISCIWEKEKRASLFAGLQFLGMLAFLLFFLHLVRIGIFEGETARIVLIGGVILGALAVFLLLRKTAPNRKALEGSKGLIVGDVRRFDERDHVFARNRTLQPGSEQYRAYYKKHPEHEAFDAKRRKKGGPIGPLGIIDRPHGAANASATLASLSMSLYLSTPEKVSPQAHIQLRGTKLNLGPEEATARVKGYARYLGADLVGITEIDPLWLYSHRGEIFHENWEDWGKEIEISHTYAIVCAEEMSFAMVGAAPHTPTAIESMKNYAKGAVIADQLAAFIANLGYSATANSLRHYDAILVPLAVDAGLGECGRLGYVMTKEFGPRVRLSAVTTDLPLVPDKPIDIGAEDFCKICKKCAVCCPSRSIPLDDHQKETNGTLRWKLNDETCFDYWGHIGTDCNICMRVCPWSHARTLPHKIIVEIITRNKHARRFFNVMDDIFYGKKPKPKQTAPRWAAFHSWEKE
jgi:reductive dehalogenase